MNVIDDETNDNRNNTLQLNFNSNDKKEFKDFKDFSDYKENVNYSINKSFGKSLKEK